ncbi:MAG: transglycosylase SLT domain-containing protein [Thermodesulfovibrionia bacterium]|nr:transglycosylase SLT domain-containing protein [Thermodesulfovibrionia bacterium]
MDINVNKELATVIEASSSLMTATDAQTAPVDVIISSQTTQEYSEQKESEINGLFERFGFNKVVQGSIMFYSDKKKSFSKSLGLASRYIKEMSAVFIEKGMPAELAFLPLIESGYRNHASSDKSASGIWQFIPSTARRYGLKIDSWVDERRDPVKSTVAASEYLSDMYDKFGSWNLALAAYNAGEGKIGMAIKQNKGDDYWKMRGTGYITEETKRFIPSFVAAAAIATYPEKYGFDSIDHAKPLIYDEVVIKASMDLSTVAEFTGAGVEDIKDLNPELKSWCTPLNVSEYNLRIPAGTKESFLSRIAEATEDELFYVKVYRVAAGDTLGKIAKMFHSSVQAIIDINSLGKDAVIVAGRDILVPVNRAEQLKAGKVVYLKPLSKCRNL